MYPIWRVYRERVYQKYIVPKKNNMNLGRDAITKTNRQPPKEAKGQL